ncbi:MAG TPA: hypothetical protein DDX39_05365 [Bacteroidales bacterium]|nr:MAG: hypothetical protein A2W98_10815 [Bacteroidetes bacterium GWF2_33_38]OFY85648.1 MAG: hypothetical protein A2236_02500 [Bacteroidetes bacterium RIFOXYA2_FULL_33_7]HBF88052.1 hypothetical protein [Bacteroidales bacterium]
MLMKGHKKLKNLKTFYDFWLNRKENKRIFMLNFCAPISALFINKLVLDNSISFQCRIAKKQ